MSAVAFVHAKGTSERVPGKNLRVLGDRALFLHAVATARAAGGVSEVVVDSDDERILRLGTEAGATPLRRPPHLATNVTTGDDLMAWQASCRPDSEIVVQVVPTAPFLSALSVASAVAMLREDVRLHSVAGVTSDALYVWRDGRPAYFGVDGRIPNSTGVPPTVWETTGLYAARTAWVLRHRRRLDPENCRPLMLGRLEAVDVNTPEDFAFAEVLWRGLHGAPAGAAPR